MGGLEFLDVQALDEPGDPFSRIERIGFRQARAGRFKMSRRFPALMVSRRTMPAWQDAEPAVPSNNEDAAGGKRPRGIAAKAEELSTATINTVMKRKPRIEPEHKSVCSTWRVSGRNETSFGKAPPTVFKGDYDSLNKANRRWEKELKRHWIGGELAPPGGRIKPHDVSEASAEAIAEARRRGRENCRELDQAYKIKRDEYKILKETNEEESAFENYLNEKQLRDNRGRKTSRKTTRKSLREAAGGLRDLFGKRREAEAAFE